MNIANGQSKEWTVDTRYYAHTITTLQIAEGEEKPVLLMARDIYKPLHPGTTVNPTKIKSEADSDLKAICLHT